jgi:hypothetical protein
MVSTAGTTELVAPPPGASRSLARYVYRPGPLAGTRLKEPEIPVSGLPPPGSLTMGHHRGNGGGVCVRTPDASYLVERDGVRRERGWDEPAVSSVLGGLWTGSTLLERRVDGLAKR